MRMTPEEDRQLKNAKIIDEILMDDVLVFDIKNLEVSEELLGEETRIKTELKMIKKGDLDSKAEGVMIEATGDGVVDALVKGMQETLKDHFKTIGAFQISSFEVEALVDRDYNSQNKADSYVNVVLSIYNSYGQRLYFSKTHRSMLRASISVVKNAFEYLCNCEAAVERIKKCIENAKERHRPDLENYYTRKLSDLVKTTSYNGI